MLYSDQMSAVRTYDDTSNWFDIWPGDVRQDCILLPCLFNIYAEKHNKLCNNTIVNCLFPGGKWSWLFTIAVKRKGWEL